MGHFKDTKWGNRSQVQRFRSSRLYSDSWNCWNRF